MSGLLHDNLTFNIQRDIAPVAYFGATPFVMVVTPSFPAKTVPEFIAYAKANPGKINMASNGTGNLTHVAGEYFKMMAGVDLFHVPYRGEMEAQADLQSGRAQVMFDPIIASLGAIKAGKLRVLAVTTPQRVASLPDTPTVSEFVPGYEVTGGLGLGATSGTPAEIIDKLNHDDQCRAGGPNIASALRRPRQHPDADEPGGLRQADRRRNRQMAQGDQIRRHQADVMRTACVRPPFYASPSM